MKTELEKIFVKFYKTIFVVVLIATIWVIVELF